MSHLVPIPGSSWAVWRLAALRSAGFPAEHVRTLSDPELAAAADRDTPAYPSAYAAAWQKASDSLAALAGAADFREAVTWQSPQLVERYLDEVARAPEYAGAVPPRKDRRRLMTVASYVQRYTVKNDSIGFYGPVGWATWSADSDPVAVTPGATLLARRRVYFEHWAIEAVAGALAADPELAAAIPPRRSPELHHTGDAVLTPRGRRIALSTVDQALLDACDGVRTTAEIVTRASERTGAEPGELRQAWQRMAGKGIVQTGFSVPVCADPEVVLASQLTRLADSPARSRALHDLRQLIAARDELPAAAEPGVALDRVNTRFHDLTGGPAARRAGQMYAGRTVVYEDTVRDVDVTLGPALLAELAVPLDLVLRSARWFCWRLDRAYRARFREIFDRLSARSGQRHVPLAALLSAATPDLTFSFRSLPQLVARAAEELRRQWQEILRPPPGVRRHRVAAEAIRDEVIRRFDCPAPSWSAARQHSPDLMIAARSQDAINAGDYLAVLSELHVSTNTLQSRVFVEQAPDPAWLSRAEAADHDDGRVILLPAKSSTGVNSRTHPSALHVPACTYWTMSPDVADEPGPVIPAGAMNVVERAGELVVVSSVDGREFDLLETLGEPLGRAAMNGFKVMDAGAHRPRLTIGRIVVSRESWQFDVAALAWADTKDAAGRFRLARRWRREQGLPERCFYLAPQEEKPMFVDFSSVVLVDVLARAVRNPSGGHVSFSEMLPDLHETWLADAKDARYTAELRMVAVDAGTSVG